MFSICLNTQADIFVSTLNIFCIYYCIILYQRKNVVKIYKTYLKESTVKCNIRAYFGRVFFSYQILSLELQPNLLFLFSSRNF